MATRADDRLPVPSLTPPSVAALVLVAALVAWLVVIDRMSGMDAGPGTDLGSFGWFLGIWVTMTAAMMLPSVAPMALVFARVSGERGRRGRRVVPTWVFVGGYVAAWTLYGLVAYGAFRLVTWAGTGWLAWDRAGPYVAGGAVIAAGIYQLTPLKEACLRQCRGPLHFVLHRWHHGRVGAVRMGVEHGFYCIGCCWGLMAILFALGVMSLFWMALIAAVILAEKTLPHGLRLSKAFAVGFAALGIWLAAAPESVPGLTDPSDAPAMMPPMEHPGMENGGPTP